MRLFSVKRYVPGTTPVPFYHYMRQHGAWRLILTVNKTHYSADLMKAGRLRLP
ncbi:hypothetical protein [Gimesia chilikensis]|uniref:hypothetical protein n=1 Tax=Gimesia chilikensis TaxID=2605989 RepID=UPI0018D62970|nr:hypothetical protein [Gimesia chilikensis]